MQFLRKQLFHSSFLKLSSTQTKIIVFSFTTLAYYVCIVRLNDLWWYIHLSMFYVIITKHIWDNLLRLKQGDNADGFERFTVWTNNNNFPIYMLQLDTMCHFWRGIFIKRNTSSGLRDVCYTIIRLIEFNIHWAYNEWCNDGIYFFTFCHKYLNFS